MITSLELTPEKLRKLHESYRKSRRRSVRDRLLQAYGSLALGLAGRYTIHPNHADDLRSAAVQGLLEALNRYDPSVGKFETYAYFWIMKMVLQEREFDRSMVRIPTSVARAHRRVRRHVQLGGSLEEFAGRLGMSLEEVEGLLMLYEQRTCTSLAECEGREAVVEAVDPDRPGQLEAVARLTAGLPDRQRRVVELRYFAEDAPLSFRDIGQRLGIGVETARATYNRAVKTLRTRMKHAGQMD